MSPKTAEGHSSESVTLPDGRCFDPHRPRSAGPLDDAELAWCRENAIALAYDPAQIGWIVAGAVDDIDLLRDTPVSRADAGDGQLDTFGDAPGAVRLRFRPWKGSDAPRFVSLLDDPEVWRHLPEPYPDPLSEPLARELIELSNVAEHHVVRAVEADGETVGQVRLTHAPATNARGEAEISYWLGRSHWGRGIGTRMVVQFSAQSFRDNPQLSAIMARVHRDNPASARILERAGYHRDGPAPDDPDIIVFRLPRDQAADPDTSSG